MLFFAWTSLQLIAAVLFELSEFHFTNIVLVLSWIMQAITKSLTKLYCIPSPFGVVPQLNFAFFQISLKDLSVALLITLISLFSFQGAILCPLLSPEISSQFLKSLFPSLITRIWWARVGSNHRPYDYQSYALASWATGPYSLGGDSRDRTGDLLLARQALSQLSYIPNYFEGECPLN